MVAADAADLSGAAGLLLALPRGLRVLGKGGLLLGDADAFVAFALKVLD